MTVSNRKILVVDDEENFLSSIRRVLRGHFTLITTTDPMQALKILEFQGPFAVVISDFRMPFMNGIELFSKIIQLAPHTQRIMLTGCAELQMAIDAINKGKITAFLTKPTPPETLRSVVFEAIRAYDTAGSSEPAASPLTAAAQTAPEPCTPLTVKELEILRCLARGCSNAEISMELNITIGTVKTHVNNLFTKMNVNNRSKVVARGIELELIK